MRYTSPSQFEPLLPEHRLKDLEVLAQKVIENALMLSNALHTTTANTITKLLRAMNAYYSNKIEGHSTHPLNIARGLKRDFSNKPKIAALQRLAVAHIEAEIEIESWIDSKARFSSLLGPVHFGLPLDALYIYFPALYPEVETQNDSTAI